MRILHIAPFNTAGVPLTFVEAERALGHVSRLITLARHPYGFPEDICLNLPFIRSQGVLWAKRLFSAPERLQVENVHPSPERIPLQWSPQGPFEEALIRFREWIWQSRIRWAMETVDFWNFDIYQLDGGLEFYRDGRIIRRLKKMGKKVICCYTGSDLRVRGVIPVIDELSDLNVTVEFDHIRLHPHIHHVFFPFDASRFKPRPFREGYPLRIGHAPSQRAAKGTEQIIQAVRDLAQRYPIELVLIENLPYRQALELKATCDIFIDQIGDLGYGINALEALAMGIPTCSSLVEGFEKAYPDHPFVTIDRRRIKEPLERLIRDMDYRRKKAVEGRSWVEKYHDARKVVQRIHRLAGLISE